MHHHITHYFSSLKQILKAQHNKSALLESSTNIGAVREKFCSNFLEEFLPSEILVTSGEVIDSFGKRVKAGQQDIVLYDSKVMRLKMDDDVQIHLVEGCLATIEVKSSLTKQHFFLALDKCKEFKQLELSLFPLLPEVADVGYMLVNKTFVEQSQELARLHKPNIDAFIKPKFYIFAYNGPSDLEIIRNWFAEYAEAQDEDYLQLIQLFPDMVCILDLGVVYRNNGFAFKLQPFVHSVIEKGVMPNDPVFLSDNESEVAMFAFHLLEAARLTQRNSRLQVLGLSLNFRSYFLMDSLIEEAEILEDIPFDMAGVNLAGADLVGVDLSRKDLTMANLSEADLRQADLTMSFLGMTNLSRADLRGADLRGAKLLQTNLAGVKYDDKTKWPEGFNPAELEKSD